MTTAALVLGGGPLGIAWQSGLLTGLARQGIDLSKSDLVLGTSAGSVVGAALAAGLDLTTLLSLVSGELPLARGASADIDGLAALTLEERIGHALSATLAGRCSPCSPVSHGRRRWVARASTPPPEG